MKEFVDPSDGYITELKAILKKAKDDDYKGYDKFDGLNSPLLNILSFENKWLHFFFQQAVKEFPFNMRKLLFVPKTRNIKGCALFAISYMNLYSLTKDKKYLNEALELISWLKTQKSKNYLGDCWGHNFLWQGLSFTIKPYEPNITNTLFVGEAIFLAYKYTKKQEYKDLLKSIVKSIQTTFPKLVDNDEELAFSYFAFETNFITINIQAMLAAFFIKLVKVFNNSILRSDSERLLQFTINHQTEYGAWYYNHPSSTSHIIHDNYHTGFILDSLLCYYKETANKRFLNAYLRGLEYYKTNLFKDRVIPKWNSKKVYPVDSHSCAQAIITFSKASMIDSSYRKLSEEVMIWTLLNMYRNKKKDFIYQRYRFFKKNFSFIRWCNAWMALALSEVLINE